MHLLSFVGKGFDGSHIWNWLVGDRSHKAFLVGAFFFQFAQFASYTDGLNRENGGRAKYHQSQFDRHRHQDTYDSHDQQGTLYKGTKGVGKGVLDDLNIRVEVRYEDSRLALVIERDVFVHEVLK